MIGNLALFIAIGFSFVKCFRESNNITSYTLKEGPLNTEWTKQVGLSPWPQYPRPQLKRKAWLNLNGIWEFKVAKSSFDLDSPPFGGVGFDRQILVPFCVESALSGIMERHTHMWYRKSFKIPADWKGRTILNFGAVDYEATVFINGQQVSFHRGGYSKFSIDVSKHLKPPGEKNELLVFVYDPTDTGGVRPVGKQAENPSHIFYTATSGIWQTVFLEPVPDVYVDKLDIDADMHGLVTIQVRASDQQSNIPVTVTVHSHQASPSQVATPLSLPLTATGTSNKSFRFQLDSPKLWSPTTPNLYYFTVQLETDTVESYLGLRTIEKKADKQGVVRPFLNGEFVFQFGTLDQGYWPDGIYTPPTREAMEFDLKLLKDLGFNMLRKHVKVESDLYYYACDQLGLLVWQDMPSLNLNPSPSIEQSVEFERQLYRMVSDLKNIPCIITWIILNEGWGQTSQSPEIELTEKVRAIDSTRLIMSVSGWRDHGAGDFSDNHHYASPQCGSPFYSLDSSPYDPKRIGSQGEFGGIGHIPSLDNSWKVEGSLNDMYHTYEITTSISAWNYRVLNVIKELKDQFERFSCSAGVYTQTSDVESEVNGIVTYDRRVVRANVEEWNELLSSFHNHSAITNAEEYSGQIILGGIFK